MQRTRVGIDQAKLLAELGTRPPLSEEEIDAQAIEDRDAWTDEELADAEPVYPPPLPDQVRALRARLGLTQAQFARRLGASGSIPCSSTSKGSGDPSGPAATLFRVTEADPEAVVRALRPRKAD